MTLRRRELLQGLVGGATGLVITGPVGLTRAGEPPSLQPPINVFLPPDWEPRTDEAFQQVLVGATLRFLGSVFKGQRLVFWRRRPHEINFAQRLRWIVHWLAIGIDRAREVYPVDPIWVLAQITQESFFYEFTISRALAAGVCQFIPPTAAEYDLVTAGPETPIPVKRPELVGEAERYYSLKEQRRRLARETREDRSLELEELLGAVSREEAAGLRDRAGRHLEAIRELEELDRGIRDAADGYREFLEANVLGRDIFDPTDTAFLRRFDQRFLYRGSLPAMVLYMARNLRARKGNIIAAAAAYNAGLKRTLDEGVYREYGRIPNIGETETYISRILVNYHQIAQRIR